MSRALDRASAEFDVMPTVVSDPVLEGGSNVDGEWTKLSTGALLMNCTVPLPDNDNSGTLANLPQTLISTANVGMGASGTGINSAGLNASFVVEAGLANSSSFRVKAISHLATSLTNPNTSARVIVLGRWK